MKSFIAIFVLLISVISIKALAGPFVDIESGAVFAGYNDLRIPGNYGTRFSLTDDLTSKPDYFVRAKLGWAIMEKHTLFVLAAPLTVESTGRIREYIFFNGVLYAPGVKLKAQYKFNSFRLTYRWDFIYRKNIHFGLGLTGKIRDAHVRIEGFGFGRTRKDLGFVPLIQTRLTWFFVDNFSFLLGADFLVGPQGRAEDALIAFQYHFNEHISIRTGYRVLEGGADNSSVYTFTLFHYAVAGITINF